MNVLIKNANVLDGSGKPPFKSDIFIRNSIITAIDDLGRQSADKTIQAAGLYASPGFIDVDTDSDHELTLFTNPEQQDFLLNGITTTIAGTCGSSLAPLLKGNLDSIRKWTDTHQVNVNWHSVREFLRVLKSRGLGVNFGTFAGHSTIRRAIIGNELRDLTTGELGLFKKILLEAMKEGAFGISTGLEYVHERGTPYGEIKALAAEVARHHGLYATHLRSETKNLSGALRETVSIAKETGCRTVINHFRPIKGFEAEFEEGINYIEQNDGEADIYFTMFPYDESHLPIYRLLPLWAQNGTLEVMSENIRNPHIRGKVLEEMDAGDGSGISIASAYMSGHIVGKTIKELAEGRGIDPKIMLLKIMELTSMRATVFVKNIDYELVKKNLTHERALLSSNSASFPPRASHSERNQAFVKFLSLMLKENLLSLEDAVKKITSTPARLYGIKDRGTLAPGKPADITIFSADFSAGAEILHTIVNGRVAVENKNFEGALAGHMIPH